MTASAESINRLSRPAAHFDAPAVSDRSVWAEPSRAWCVEAYRRSRNAAWPNWAEKLNNNQGVAAEETDGYSQTTDNDQSRVGRSPTRRRIICRTKVPVMKATTHSETPPPQSLWPRSLYPALTIDSCNHVDTHH
jgi:hypothetical protein